MVQRGKWGAVVSSILDQLPGSDMRPLIAPRSSTYGQGEVVAGRSLRPRSGAVAPRLGAPCEGRRRCCACAPLTSTAREYAPWRPPVGESGRDRARAGESGREQGEVGREQGEVASAGAHLGLRAGWLGARVEVALGGVA